MKTSHIASEVTMQTENEVRRLKSLKNMFSVHCDDCTLICETQGELVLVLAPKKKVPNQKWILQSGQVSGVGKFPVGIEDNNTLVLEVSAPYVYSELSTGRLKFSTF